MSCFVAIISRWVPSILLSANFKSCVMLSKSMLIVFLSFIVLKICLSVVWFIWLYSSIWAFRALLCYFSASILSFRPSFSWSIVSSLLSSLVRRSTSSCRRWHFWSSYSFSSTIRFNSFFTSYWRLPRLWLSKFNVSILSLSLSSSLAAWMEFFFRCPGTTSTLCNLSFPLSLTGTSFNPSSLNDMSIGDFFLNGEVCFLLSDFRAASIVFVNSRALFAA